MRLADGREFSAAAVVLTTGTFLRGLIHIGERQTPAGRVGEAPSIGLSRTLERLGFALGRLKTGTPPRLDGRTIDWGSAGDAARRRAAGAVFDDDRRIENPPVECGITRTNEATHASHTRRMSTARRCIPGRSRAAGRAIARRLKTRSSVSASETAHQIFLEPEGLDDPTVYPNGISTSLPEEVQLALVATIPGLREGADDSAGLCHRI